MMIQMANYEAADLIAKMRNIQVCDVEDVSVTSKHVEFFCKGDKKYTSISINKLMKYYR